MEIEQKPEDIGEKSLRLRVLSLNRVSPLRLELNTEDVESDNDRSHIVAVEGIWTQSHIVENTILHLINPVYDKRTKIYSVNNSTGLLVIEPDNLLTCTLVASSLYCERKTWLNNVFLGQVGSNRAMLVGTLVHETFQHGVKNRCADLTKLIEFLDEQLDDATVMLEIRSMEMHLKDIRTEAVSYLTSVKEWIEKFMLAGPRHPLTNDSDLEVKIIGVNDIEENVWSTKYGLKGKIDVTGSVRVYDKKTRTLKDKTLPLELKTGNPNLSLSHQAQVSLYSMMIEDRYAETNQGLVIYLKNKAAMHNVTLTHNTKRDLVQRRNQLNYFLKSHFNGPEMMNQTRMCKSCERQTECILVSKLFEGDLDRYVSMKALESDAIGHLDARFLGFFKRYHEKLVSLITKTETLSSGDQTKGSFWTYSSSDAETRGTGFGKLQATPKGGLIVFKRHPDCKDNLVKPNGIEAVTPPMKKMKINDYFKTKVIVNGTDLPKMKPFNTEANFSRCRIAISFDDDGLKMDKRNSSTALAIGFMQELKDNEFTIKIYEGSLEQFKPNQMYRIDKIEKRTNLDIERLVLARLLAREDWRCDRVRQLILDSDYQPEENITMNLFVLDANLEELTELDKGQQEVAIDAVSTNNYFVITEKTFPDRAKLNKLVSVIVRIICNLGRSALIVAPTVDQLCDLMKILQKNIKFILIDDGKSTKARFTYATHLVKLPQNENLDLEKKFDIYIKQHELAPVVFTTFAMSIGGLQFTQRKFDYCIAFDCDTTELLISLSPMFCSDRHIIIDVRNTEGGATKNDVSQDSLGEHLRTLRGIV